MSTLDAYIVNPAELKAFFMALLAASREHQKVPENLVEDAYLAGMLERFVWATPELLDALHGPLLPALYQAPQKETAKVKELAELFLFLLGLYTERLYRTGVGLDVFVTGTRTAYSLVSSRASVRNPFLPVFQSFAHDVEPIARVLNDVSDTWLRRSQPSLLRLMERYAALHSQRDLDTLLRHNVVLITEYDGGHKIIH